MAAGGRQPALLCSTAVKVPHSGFTGRFYPKNREIVNKHSLAQLVIFLQSVQKSFKLLSRLASIIKIVIRKRKPPFEANKTKRRDAGVESEKTALFDGFSQ